MEEEYSILNPKYYEDEDLGQIDIDVQKVTKAQYTSNAPEVANKHRAFAVNSKEKDQVFIVHRREESTKTIIAQFIKELGLEPIILHEQPDRGRTIIEKFEDHSSNVKYAVVLLTPDDLGGLRSEPDKMSQRACQNVVFEMGHFFGSLGRGNVCALISPGVERPSDIDGILYIPLDETDKWKGRLFKELKAAELDVVQSISSSEAGIGLVGVGTGLSDPSGQIRPL